MWIIFMYYDLFNPEDFLNVLPFMTKQGILAKYHIL